MNLNVWRCRHRWTMLSLITRTGEHFLIRNSGSESRREPVIGLDRLWLASEQQENGAVDTAMTEMHSSACRANGVQLAHCPVHSSRQRAISYTLYFSSPHTLSCTKYHARWRCDKVIQFDKLHYWIQFSRLQVYTGDQWWWLWLLYNRPCIPLMLLRLDKWACSARWVGSLSLSADLVEVFS